MLVGAMGDVIRAVTHLDVSFSDVYAAAEIINELQK
jgi:hypothetical protein